MMLTLGMKYSMRALLCDVNYCGFSKLIIFRMEIHVFLGFKLRFDHYRIL